MTALDELRGFLTETLPPAWVDAVAAGDEARVFALKEEMDNPTFVRALGRAGWVAPQWPVEHGGRGLDIDTARQVIDVLDEWNVPRVPRGSGMPLAAPTIIEWSSDETKKKELLVGRRVQLAEELSKKRQPLDDKCTSNHLQNKYAPYKTNSKSLSKRSIVVRSHEL